MDGKKHNHISTRDWEECASMCTLHLNPHIRRYDSFTPDQRHFLAFAVNADWCGGQSAFQGCYGSGGGFPCNPNEIFGRKRNGYQKYPPRCDVEGKFNLALNL